MNNKDLIKQYIDNGQSIGDYQFDKLSDNLKVSYLRKRMIAFNQDDDYKLLAYEMFGAPESYKPIIVNYLLSQMNDYFEEADVDDEDKSFMYKYGDTNPVVSDLLKGNNINPKVDNFIIAFTKNEDFIKFLNKATMNKILLKSNNPSHVFSYFGSLGEKYKEDKIKNISKVIEDIIYSNNPKNLIEFLGKDELLNHFKNMESKEKAYRLSNSPNPKVLLSVVGNETMNYIKQ